VTPNASPASRRQFTTPRKYNSPHFPMALLVDKHRPRSLETLSYHPELSDRLRSLVSFPRSSGRIACTSNPVNVTSLSCTSNTPSRQSQLTSLTYLFTDLQALGRRLVSLRLSRSSTVLVLRRSKSTLVSSKQRQIANSSSTSWHPSTTSKSRPQM
jgi:hypothetical protein